MKSIFKFVAPALMAATCLAPVFSAEAGTLVNRPGMWTASVMAGYLAYDGKHTLQSTSAPSALLAYNLDKNWAVEGLVAKTSSRRSHRNSQNAKNVSGQLYSINSLYHFDKTFAGNQPYALAGLSVTALKPNGRINSRNQNGDEATHQVNANAGVGVQYFLHRNIALRAESRAIYTPSGGKMDFLSSVGISLAFGGGHVHSSRTVALFANDSAVVPSGARGKLQRYADHLAKNKKATLELNGYASAVGEHGYNVRLSQQRADNTKQFIVSAFMSDAKRIRAKGRGESVQVASNRDEAGQSKNRRVEARLHH